jgi:hypothetical protein
MVVRVVIRHIQQMFDTDGSKEDTYMTKDPLEKETFTDITLIKSVVLYNIQSATGKKNNPTISVICFSQKRLRTPK